MQLEIHMMRPVLVLCIKAPLGLEEVCLASIGIDTLLDGGWLILFKYWETVQAARTHTYIHHVTWLTTHDNPKKRCYALAWAHCYYSWTNNSSPTSQHRMQSHVWNRRPQKKPWIILRYMPKAQKPEITASPSGTQQIFTTLPIS